MRRASLSQGHVQHTFRNGQRGRPLIPQNVQANRAIRIDVGMVNLGGEADFGRFEGVVGREGNGEEKDAASVW